MTFKNNLTVFLIAMCFQLQAQVSREIQIGDLCPDVTIHDVINYEKDVIKISDFRGTILILDFWATWCNPCVRSFPKMDSLQKKFTGKLQILPVSMEDKKTVAPLLKNINKIKHIQPPSVTGDTILNAIFKHTYIPHYVWIDQNGIVRGITGAEEVTEEKINELIHVKNSSLSEKKDRVKNVNQEKAAFIVVNPILENNSERLDTLSSGNLLYHSVLSGFIEGIAGYENVADSTRITAINQPIANLYSAAIGHFSWEFLMPNRLVVEIKDSMLYYQCTGQFMSTKKYVENGDYLKWANAFALCYELKVPKSLVSKRFEIMLNELNTCFGPLYGITGAMEKRKMKTLVLTRTGKEDKLKTTGQNRPYSQNAYFYGLYNEPFRYLVNDLRQFYQLSYALIDETGYEGNVDIELNCELADLQQLNKALERYGLKFTEELRDVDMIVIKEKEKKEQ